MALIKCIECNGEISDRAILCPHCGSPTDKTESMISSSNTDSKISVFSKAFFNGLLNVFIITAWVAAITFSFFLILTTIFPESRIGVFASEVIENSFDYVDKKLPFLKEFVSAKNDISLKESENSSNADSLIVQINSNGNKTYPVQYINLWGYQFYTSKVDSTGSIDIGSADKQKIAELFKNISFPASLTKKLIIANIDPTLVNTGDKMIIPWLSTNSKNYLDLQPQVGTYQGVYGGAVILVNNRTGFDLSVLAHELGHVIGFKLTNDEWAEYYKLRGIPINTLRNSSDWSLSPQEDFAEVYRYIYYSNSKPIMTNYGLLVPKFGSSDSILSPCFILADNLKNDWLKKNGTMELYQYTKESQERALVSIQSDPELQKCRAENITDEIFGTVVQYVRQVDEETRQFIKDVISR